MKQTKPAQAMELRSLSLVFDGLWRGHDAYGGQPTHRQAHPRGGFVEVSFSINPTPYVRSKYELPFGAMSTAPPGSDGG